MLSILFFPALLFLYFQVQEKVVQHEMVERLEHSQLQQLTIHHKSVQWYKKGREIIVNSTLFDVHSFSMLKDSIIFTGLFDKKETELKNQVNELLTKKEQGSSSSNLIILKLILQLWFNNEDRKDILLRILFSIAIRNVGESGHLISAYISIPFPPPKA